MGAMRAFPHVAVMGAVPKCNNLIVMFILFLLDDNEISASGENTKAPIGTEVLYGTFQNWGYQTLFQEDLCWYDIWGSALTEIQKRAMPSSDSEFKSR